MKTQPPEWFQNAKLGIFIHWGIYSVKGIAESWSFFNGQISYEDYMKQLDGFTASSYDPAAWARLFKKAGADYAVLTTKHHDGVALWDTVQTDLSVVKRSPAARELVAPFCEALRAEGLRVGLYFSHLDWSHPYYGSVMREGDPDPEHSRTQYDKLRFAFPRADEKEDPAAWQRFLQFHRAQLQELCERFHPDLLWFDSDWEPLKSHAARFRKVPRIEAGGRRIGPGWILDDRNGPDFPPCREHPKCSHQWKPAASPGKKLPADSLEPEASRFLARVPAREPPPGACVAGRSLLCRRFSSWWKLRPAIGDPPPASAKPPPWIPVGPTGRTFHDSTRETCGLVSCPRDALNK